MTNAQPIRRATPTDLSALMAVVRESGLFGPDELDYMEADLAAWAGGGSDRRWLIHDGPDPQGAAMLAPEPMSGDAWNMLFLATRPGARRRGVARALLAAAAETARGQGGRLLLIDTSSDEDQAPARVFYAASGCDHVATIPGYYADGVDKVTYLRRLA
ncbi:GNAT family N-acetyltransferase [Jannaschia sp. Os4]|uniref:GNAT family N-acetyltransferase n=1 Tax=Jannaschia sp. Os4 TaxID=2807617 RepID=UPI00193A347B|nr:GNAT family N-acetyltransferase [Jannaschia sp. Os4]MBM2576171.1 GNAT family N-acetyltransferase [Jannaschia sp. Os4]